MMFDKAKMNSNKRIEQNKNICPILFTFYLFRLFNQSVETSIALLSRGFDP